MKDKSDNVIYKIKLNKPYAKMPVARLTVECHKFLNRLFLQTCMLTMSLCVLCSHLLAPSSLFDVGKILIYVNITFCLEIVRNSSFAIIPVYVTDRLGAIVRRRLGKASVVAL